MVQNNNLAKVSVIGAGNVGSTCAFLLAINGLADVYLYDKFEKLAQAKALDIGQSSVAFESPSRVVACEDISEIKDSQLVIIAAGMPRKPGMSRQDLIKINGDIATELAAHIKKHAPEAIVMVVANPLDILTWIVLNETGFDRRRVFGMAGIVDNSRLRYFAAQKANIDSRQIRSHVLGVHADQMVIPQDQIYLNNEPVDKVLSPEQINEVTDSTRNAGAQIVGLLGNGSAYYMPGTGAYLMARSIIKDTGDLFDASVFLEGEYSLAGVCLGVSVKIGAQGIKEVIELELDEESLDSLKENASLVKEQLKLL